MDLLRTCYTHKVFWDDAKTLSSTIIWYRCSDNAQWFPFPHVFSSERYDTVHWFDDGAGEDELSGPTYYKGFPPARFTGQNFCGDPSWFLGAPSDAPALELDENGWPACCNVEGGAYGYTGPSVNPPPPSTPISTLPCDQCIDGIGPAVFKVTLAGFTGPCAGYNGVHFLSFVGNCQWTVLFPPPLFLELVLTPGFVGFGTGAVMHYLPPSIPYDCLTGQFWTNVTIPSWLCGMNFGTVFVEPA